MRPDSFAGPVAVLTGPHARSFGDLNAFKMRSYPTVRFFGLPTNGSFPAPGSVPHIENRWGTWYYQHAEGQMQSLVNNEGLLMHEGFPVDEEVWLTRDGVAKAEDDVVRADEIEEARPRVDRSAELVDGWGLRDFDDSWAP